MLPEQPTPATAKVDKAGFYYFDGSAWQKAGGDDWSLTGNAGTDPSVNFIGTTDDNDIVFKRQNLKSGWIGIYNTSFGYASLGPNASGNYNSAFGVGALEKNTTGFSNIAIGAYALQSLTQGSSNIAIGGVSFANLTTGWGNLGIGGGFYGITTDFGNTYIGINTAGAFKGYENLILGFQSFRNVGQLGNYNVFIGNDNGKAFVSGNNNTVLGSFSDLPSSTGSYQLSIANSIYGLNINDEIYGNDLIGIQTTNPSERLDVNGNIKVRGTGIAITDGNSCTNSGTISYGTDGNFYGCIGTNVWKKLNN